MSNYNDLVEKYANSTVSGSVFNKLFKGYVIVKITNHDESYSVTSSCDKSLTDKKEKNKSSCEKGKNKFSSVSTKSPSLTVKFTDGLNVNLHENSPGIYFTLLDAVKDVTNKFVKKNKWLREVSVPDDANVKINNQHFITDNLIFNFKCVYNKTNVELLSQFKTFDNLSNEKWLSYLNINPQILSLMPKHLQNQKLVDNIVNNNPYLIHYVRPDLQTTSLWLSVLSTHKNFFKYMPNDLQTSEVVDFVESLVDDYHKELLNPPTLKMTLTSNNPNASEIQQVSEVISLPNNFTHKKIDHLLSIKKAKLYKHIREDLITDTTTYVKKIPVVKGPTQYKYKSKGDRFVRHLH